MRTETTTLRKCRLSPQKLAYDVDYDNLLGRVFSNAKLGKSCTTVEVVVTPLSLSLSVLNLKEFLHLSLRDRSYPLTK